MNFAEYVLTGKNDWPGLRQLVVNAVGEGLTASQVVRGQAVGVMQPPVYVADLTGAEPWTWETFRYDWRLTCQPAQADASPEVAARIATALQDAPLPHTGVSMRKLDGYAYESGSPIYAVDWRVYLPAQGFHPAPPQPAVSRIVFSPQRLSVDGGKSFLSRISNRWFSRTGSGTTG